jgi:hypothetical protein
VKRSRGAPAALSTEQHVKIRETLRGEKAERLTNVPFSITVGEAIPRTVHRYKFRIMEYAPQYRDYGPEPVPKKFKGFPEEMAVRPSQIRAGAAESALMIPSTSPQHGQLIFSAAFQDALIRKRSTRSATRPLADD